MEPWRPILPPSETTAWLLPLLLVLISGFGFLAGNLKIRHHWRVGDTRKLFHFAILSTATVLSITLGWGGVNLLGGLMGLYVFTVVRAGPGNPLFEGIARESDAPWRGFYVVLPYVSTAVGGMLSAYLFGPHASIGMVASGWGDAVGEPVGIRAGKHHYRIPSLAGGGSSRSFEGSAAVLIAATFGALVVIVASPALVTPNVPRLIAASLAVGVASAGAEALSPRGMDNLTLQLAASAAAKALVEP